MDGYLRCLSVLTLSEGGGGGEDLVLWEGGLFQGAQRVISPSAPGRARRLGSLSGRGGEPSAEWRAKWNVTL